jgi:LytS/YehU family sensor histidine kinase
MTELKSEKRTTKWWYLLPIFVGVAGGLIVFFVLRKKDAGMAKIALFLGIILEAVHIVGMLVIRSFETSMF